MEHPHIFFMCSIIENIMHFDHYHHGGNDSPSYASRTILQIFEQNDSEYVIPHNLLLRTISFQAFLVFIIYFHCIYPVLSYQLPHEIERNEN